MQDLLQGKGQHEEDPQGRVNQLTLELDDRGILAALAVEAKTDERIALNVDVEAGTVTISSTDITGLKAAMNTVFRMIETAEGVKEVLGDGRTDG